MKVNIETTNLCNAKCICCPNKDMTRPRGYMELELLNRIIKQLPENVNEICLSIFGEPLMDHRLPEVLTIVRKLYRKRLLFFTNGSLLGDWIDDAIYENLDEIIISFLGWSPESYHKNMGLNFNEIVPRIKYFIANAPDKLKIKVISLDLGYTPQKVLAFKKLFPEGVIYRQGIGVIIKQARTELLPPVADRTLCTYSGMGWLFYAAGTTRPKSSWVI